MSNKQLEQVAPGILGIQGFAFSAIGLYFAIRGAILLYGGSRLWGAAYLLLGVALGWTTLKFWRALWSVRKKDKGQSKGQP